MEAPYVPKGIFMSNRRADTSTKISVVRGVAAKLHAAEEAIDLAIIKLSELNCELPAARMEAKLSATVCQPAFDLSVQALQSLVQCRRQTVEAHEVLAGTQRDIGLGAYAMGDGWKVFQSEQANPLILVADKAA
ncbi:hypothetical protein EUU23_10445 [Sphingorhabdus sp. IMCC26285]|uniref:Uncharacterized protein n=1 Tax=Sphingorhabdus profundilacus TaxID=2509718 RepID=A0A6I4LYH6_9SPHN|nr:hypothetical protein [Sphingorhabdus profundilacus]MVZ98111.1 hypothetical protein [Sphingorhabdus profundilacus]